MGFYRPVMKGNSWMIHGRSTTPGTCAVESLKNVFRGVYGGRIDSPLYKTGNNGPTIHRVGVNLGSRQTAVSGPRDQ